MKGIVLATQNPKKRRELEELTRPFGFLVRNLADVGLADLEVDEVGLTFAANAQLKADVVAGLLPAGVRRETFAVVADDSGLIVDALDGKPGVRSARFAADHGTGNGDADNNALLLLLLAAVPEEMRAARFASAVCAHVVDGGQHVEAFGTVEGRIAFDLRGDGGFGYDPLFLPDETPGRRMAELTADEKHAISHRGRAMRALIDKLAALSPSPSSSSSSSSPPSRSSSSSSSSSPSRSSAAPSSVQAAQAFVFRRAKPR